MAGRVLVSVVCVLARLPKRFIVICSFQNQRTPAPALGSCRNISGQICTKSTWQISSPAVAERPRDASCLSVVCYNSQAHRERGVAGASAPGPGSPKGARRAPSKKIKLV